MKTKPLYKEGGQPHCNLQGRCGSGTRQYISTDFRATSYIIVAVHYCEFQVGNIEHNWLLICIIRLPLRGLNSAENFPLTFYSKHTNTGFQVWNTELSKIAHSPSLNLGIIMLVTNHYMNLPQLATDKQLICPNPFAWELCRSLHCPLGLSGSSQKLNRVGRVAQSNENYSYILKTGNLQHLLIWEKLETVFHETALLCNPNQG
jgi:hypothetical protein